MMQLLTIEEVAERARGIRVIASKLLAYYIVLLPVALPLAILEWLGSKAEDAFDFIDRPAYRWRSAQEELRRELIRDARRRSRAEK